MLEVLRLSFLFVGFLSALNLPLFETFQITCETCIKPSVPWVTGWARLRQGIDAWKPAPSFQEMHAKLEENLGLLEDRSGAVHLPKATDEALARANCPKRDAAGPASGLADGQKTTRTDTYQRF